MIDFNQYDLIIFLVGLVGRLDYGTRYLVISNTGSE